MHRSPHRTFGRTIAAGLLMACAVAHADSTPQTLPFAQDWTDTGLITANDDWSGVPGIVGYRGDDLTGGTGTDPQTILADGTGTPIDVNANQTNPNTFTAGGLTEFELANPTVSLTGSGTADAPFLLIALNTLGQSDIRVQYTLRDLEDGGDNAVQPVALQYRIGDSGDFTNVPDAFVADATAGPNVAGPDIPVDVTLPTDAGNQALLQVRIITANAPGNDENVGVDDIAVSAQGGGGSLVLNIASASQDEGDAGTAPMDFTVTLSGPAPAGGVAFTATTANGSAQAPGDYSALIGAAFSIAEGQTSATVPVQIVGDAVGEPDETFTVDIATGTPDIVIGTGTATGTIGNDDLAVLEIFEIQGAGPRSPFAPATGNGVGQAISTIGNIVTAISANGFFMQTPDARDDNDPMTSNGIFVFTGGAPSVALGDAVDVDGSVQEFFDWTQLTDTTVTVTGSGDLPTAVELDETRPSPAMATLSCGTSNFECYENMRVSVAAGAVVQGNQRFASDPFGEAFVTASGERTRREKGLLPNVTPPVVGLPVWDGNPEVFELDADGAGAVPTGTPIFGGELFEATGVMAFQFGNFALRPVTLTRVEIDLPRPVPDSAGDAELRVASMNTLNICVGGCDPVKVGRVADYIGNVLNLPDVIGLQEVGSADAAAVLASRLEDDFGVAYVAYSFAPPSGDGIRNGFLVRADRVTVTRVRELQADITIDQCSGTPPCPLHDRPPLMLDGTFTAGDGERFSVMNNHTRSLIGIGEPAPEGPRVRFKRFEQGKAIATLVQRFQDGEELDPDAPVGDIDTVDVPLILVGDYNAFEVTDGYVDVIGLIAGTYDDAENEYQLAGPNIVDPPLRNVVLDVVEPDRYSYTFREDFGPLIGESPRQVGSIQVLDHALVNTPALNWCGGMVYGRGNADAPAELRNTGTGAIGSSDHDGFVVRLFTDRLFAHDFEQPGRCMR
jgi:hypothetical protein